MKLKLLPIIAAFALMMSCVPAKEFANLENKYNELKAERNNLENELDQYRNKGNDSNLEINELSDRLADVNNRNQQLEQENAALSQTIERLKHSYDALEQNSSSTMQENSAQNRRLIAELEEKQKKIAEEQARLTEMQQSIARQTQRIKELENSIVAKEQKMQDLKNSISSAMSNFEGKGLTVHTKDGKVYVSMENKLLFDSGSWTVGEQGKQAVKQLGYVLAENRDINVLIEGHTDNVPYGGSGALTDNWDLSTKRATAIVNLLEANKNINPRQLTAAGRGEYYPIATNETAEGKAKNRRIEVILTPKYDEISRLLSDEGGSFDIDRAAEEARAAEEVGDDRR
ncbi:OmpA family protein [Mesonia sp. K7]|uniref:OmpA/MotB family protein n=1 Tax=Mesonia sp. K7 TaxID=2218606 RepID=UPI000DA7C85B|nr:OmpA family protein [Mesonia sp. K7]PZD78986.1 cell envelope biogenesis protein OmpA [Mesonia sp. K7]